MMKYPTLLFSAMISLALSGCALGAQLQQDAAQAAYEEQNYPAARDLALDVLTDDQDNATMLTLLVRTQLALGAWDDALASLDQLQEIDALPDDHHRLRAEALLQTGKSAEALDLLDSDTSPESWRLRALAAQLANDDEGVRAAFAQGREAAGNAAGDATSDAIEGRAKLFAAEAGYHLTRGNRKAARDAVGRAQQAAPRRTETQFVTARLARLEGNHEIAARAYRAILQKSPDNLQALLGAINSLQRIDRDDLADPFIAQGREAYPGDLRLVYYAALADSRKGNWVAVRDLLQQFETRIAGRDATQLLYAESLLQLEQDELARAILTSLRKERRGDAQVEALYQRAIAATGR